MRTDVDVLRGEHMKQGDTLPALRVKLFEGDDPFNLDGYDVTMKMKLAESDTLAVDDAATVEQGSRGIVTYDWSSGETDDAGTYEVEFVADNGTDTLSFPNSGFARLYIEEGF